jgi:hypothetical protein
VSPGDEPARSAPAKGSWVRDLPLLLVALPVVGVLLGGVYYFPVWWLTRGREPWTTGLLALATTALGLGAASGAARGAALAVMVVALALFAVTRKAKPSLKLEDFGLVHAVALLGAWLAYMAARVARGNPPS